MAASSRTRRSSTFGADLDHRQGRRQRSARHDVLGLDLFLGVIEIDECA
jgi:hypothetical protein